MNIIQHIIRGCGKLEYCGEHPGTEILFVLICMGMIAGAKGGLLGCLVGSGLMALVFGPMYLYGAYDRSVEDMKIKAKKK